MTTTVGLLSPLLPPTAVTAAVAEEHQQQDYYYVPQPQPARVVRMKMWSDDDDGSSYCADDNSTVSIFFTTFVFPGIKFDDGSVLLWVGGSLGRDFTAENRWQLHGGWLPTGDSKFPPTVTKGAAAAAAETVDNGRVCVCVIIHSCTRFFSYWILINNINKAVVLLVFDFSDVF